MTFEDKKQRLISYLKVKLQEQDWHAVSDCANDLRCLESELAAVHKLLPYKRAYQLLVKNEAE